MALPASDSVKSVVCLMLGEIGDLLVTVPSLEALKTRYPNARLTLILRKPLADLVRLNPHVDETLLFDNSSRWNKLKFLMMLRGRQWDLWVDLHTPTHNTWCTNDHVFKRNALLMRAAKTRYRTGFDVPKLGKHLTHPVPAPSEATLQQENIVDTTLRVTHPEGIQKFRKKLVVSPEAAAWAQQFIADRQLDDVPMIALFFGAKQQSDVWPEANIRGFIDKALTTFPAHALLMLGGPHEAVVGDRLADMCTAAPHRLVNQINRCSLLQTAALIGHCRAMVSTDSGPMHIADAVGVPLVVLFGAKTYLPVWLPQQQRKEVLNYRPPCSPCFSSVCHNDSLCMKSITSDQVIGSLQRLLAGP